MDSLLRDLKFAARSLVKRPVLTITAVITLAPASMLTLVALLAGFLPARKASKVNPLVALRYE